MSWTFDAPSGVYRNHFLSRKIRRAAIADVQFMRWMRPEPGYGKMKGEYLTITRVLNLPLAERVNELDNLPSGRPAIETKSISVSQWGYKVPLTEFEQHLTHYNINDPIQMALRDQMALTMDDMAAEAMKKTPIKYVPTSTGYNLTTNGTPSGVSDRDRKSVV